VTGHTTDAVPADQEPPARATASRLLRHPWRLLLPALPDVIALLVAQGELTITGMDAFEAWSTRGDPDAAAAVRTAQHQAYEARRQLLTALQTALSTPIDQEDLYLLSERIDHVMNMARNTVREGEVLTWSPDTAASQMGARLAAGARALVDGFRLLVKDPDQAGKQADRQRRRAPRGRRLPASYGRAAAHGGPASGPDRSGPLPALPAGGPGYRRRGRPAVVRRAPRRLIGKQTPAPSNLTHGHSRHIGGHEHPAQVLGRVHGPDGIRVRWTRRRSSDAKRSTPRIRSPCPPSTTRSGSAARAGSEPQYRDCSERSGRAGQVPTLRPCPDDAGVLPEPAAVTVRDRPANGSTCSEATHTVCLPLVLRELEPVGIGWDARLDGDHGVDPGRTSLMAL